MNILNGADIPNINFDDGHLNNNKFHVTSDDKDVVVEVDEGSNALKLTPNNLGAGFTSSDFRYELWFLAATGTVEVAVSQVHFTAEVVLQSQ